MKEYMDYILQSFYRASGWSEDNSYENIVATSEGEWVLALISRTGTNTTSNSADRFPDTK